MGNLKEMVRMGLVMYVLGLLAFLSYGYKLSDLVKKENRQKMVLGIMTKSVW